MRGESKLNACLGNDTQAGYRSSWEELGIGGDLQYKARLPECQLNFFRCLTAGFGLLMAHKANARLSRATVNGRPTCVISLLREGLKQREWRRSQHHKPEKAGGPDTLTLKQSFRGRKTAVAWIG